MQKRQGRRQSLPFQHTSCTKDKNVTIGGEDSIDEAKFVQIGKLGLCFTRGLDVYVSARKSCDINNMDLLTSWQ